MVIIQVYAPTSNIEEAEVEQFYEDPQNFLELPPKKICPFHYRGLTLWEFEYNRLLDDKQGKEPTF